MKNKYKPDILFMVIDSSSQTKLAKFLRNFTKVKKEPVLRILDMRDKIKRYRFHGSMRLNVIDNFLLNFKEKNLKPFVLSENLKFNQKKNGLREANYFDFKKAFKNKNQISIFYIYSERIDNLETHLEELEMF